MAPAEALRGLTEIATPLLFADGSVLVLGIVPPRAEYRQQPSGVLTLPEGEWFDFPLRVVVLLPWGEGAITLGDFPDSQRGFVTGAGAGGSATLFLTNPFHPPALVTVGPHEPSVHVAADGAREIRSYTTKGELARIVRHRVGSSPARLADPSGRLLLVRRPPSGLLGGLWAFPEIEVGDDRRAVSAARKLARSLGFVPSPRGGGALPPVHRAFTHLRARYLPVLLRVRAERMDALGRRSGRWVDPSGLDEVALPAAQQRIAAAAAERVSGTEHSRRTPRELSKSTREHRLR